MPAKSNRFRTNQKFDPTKPIELQFCKFHISDLEVSSSLRSFQNELFDKKSKFSKAREQENLKKFLARKNVKTEKGSVQTDLRTHNSLTALSKNIKLGLKGVLKSKIPSMTAIETNSTIQKSGSTKYSYWEDLTRLPTFPTDPEKHLGLQISKSSNDNNRRSVTKFKKEEAGSVSDSKLLNTDLETKKRIKKCDKKSRGDSSKKEKEIVGKKQVQWKTEVDVIYFSTHLAANGDRTGEVIGRVMEPLREEWEQQRKGFYAKIVPYHFESHIKDHFISLLKI